MKLYVLYHYDGRDYYDKIRTECGVYSSREKAMDAYRKIKETKGFNAQFWDLKAHNENFHFDIDEVELDEIIYPDPL